ncbi:hypothetical protein SLEP1_g30980 [Rubroshorea leprosula]|uniref:Histone-binding protein RBBP4-like N-terminal domain-containing protein n=1 Tax=Rubroshorea leprosula TaxID=152421 RepID=A0AAV5KAZ9_9ROSI|nr:hypothetical protein SLEP1_g30980 [Rubroshorea leprosula]
MADDPENPDQVEEEFSLCKKNTPFLYDLVISHPLEWSSLSVHWVPLPPVPYTADLVFGVHKLVLRTHTSAVATDFLMIADAVLPTLDSDSNVAGKNEDLVIPKVEVTQRMRVGGEVNRASCMLQKPTVIAAKTSGTEIFLFDYSKREENQQEDECDPELRLRGHDKEGYAYGMCLHPAAPQDKVLNAMHVYEAHQSVVEDVSWHLKNENIFGSAGDDCQLMIWDLRTNQTQNCFKVHERDQLFVFQSL